MNPATAAQDVPWAILVLAAEDAYDQAQGAAPSATILAPAPDPRLSPAWTIRGYLTAQDALFRRTLDLGACRVFFGWLLQSVAEPARFAIAIRGTVSRTEWLIDAEFLPRAAHPAAGEVESGFWSLYQTMRYRPIGATEDLPLVSAITAIVGAGSVVVCGHSLGGALAQLLLFDLADANRLSRRASGRFFASPRVGDIRFTVAFDGAVADYRAYAFERDRVPTVPIGFGYVTLPRLTALTADGMPFAVQDTPSCAHHLTTYIKLLDPSFDLVSLPACDAAYAACIVPAASPAATEAL